MKIRKVARKAMTAVAAVAVCCGSLTALAADQEKAQAKPESAAPKIQLAILLDTSGSMDGLINQARTQLWKIVNQLAVAEQNGQEPDMQVALYEYGKSSLAQQDGYLRMIVPLTDDLDKISEELFALKTNGGEEYCGHVIQAATKELKWSPSNDDLKLIFIAGNEAFTQGSVDYKSACAAAINKGITVNTIFCGPNAEGLKTGWADGAKLADGSYLSIDQNQQVAEIATPFDKQLVELSGQINKTYVTFGSAKKRRAVAGRQLAQDAAAKTAAPAVAAERAEFKGSGKYRTAGDLVNALESNQVKLKDLKAEELPEELKKMTLEEREAHVAKLAKEREEIQQKIQKVAQQRKEYIAEQRRKQAADDKADSLDEAIIKAVRDQAGKKQFRFKSDEKK